MAGLQEALQCLGPTTWDEVPKTQNELREYLRSIADQARLIVDSVPEQPLPEESDGTQNSHNGNNGGDDDTHHDINGGGGGGTYRVTSSSARAGTTDPNILSFQQQWSKPLKPGNARDNPYNIPMYKLQAHDGKPTWFGRRSVHAGMPFSRWKEKLSGELEWTLKANAARVEKGQSPDRVVRGLGAAKKAEEVQVLDTDGGGGEVVLGGVKVYDVCAHFPKPTTPRDFVQLNVSWDGTAADGVEGRCRNWLSVSKPCVHPDLSSYDGYLRGEYESVEFIREILPVREDVGQAPAASTSDPDEVPAGSPTEQEDKKVKSIAQEHGTAGDDKTKPYPVEWIMVTRSDPGGSIPRWIVEKGTPKSIWGDTVKFIDWARRDEDKVEEEADGIGRKSVDDSADADSDVHIDNYPEEQRNGLIANFAYLVNAGLQRYAPAVLDYVPYQHAYGSTQRISYDIDDDDDDDDDTSTISAESISPNSSNNNNNDITTNKTTKTKNAARESLVSQDKASSSASLNTNLVDRHNIPPLDTIPKDQQDKLSSLEKQLAKLAQRKRDTQDKLELTRMEIEELGLDTGTAPAVVMGKGPGNGTGTGNGTVAAAAAAAGTEVMGKEERKEKEKEEKEEKKREKERDRDERKEKEIERKEKENERKEKEKEEKREKKREKEREKEELKEKKKNDKKKKKEGVQGPEPEPEQEPEQGPGKGPQPESESDDEKSTKTTTVSEKAASSNTNISTSSKSKSKPNLSRTTTATSNDPRKSTSTSSNHQSPNPNPNRTSTSTMASTRSTAQIHKAASGLFAQESKLLKDLAKIERDQIKTASKIDARQQKQADKEEKTRSRSEVEMLRKEVDALKMEVERLKGERGE